jgi:hypothetical protein
VRLIQCRCFGAGGRQRRGWKHLVGKVVSTGAAEYLRSVRPCSGPRNLVSLTATRLVGSRWAGKSDKQQKMAEEMFKKVSFSTP